MDEPMTRNEDLADRPFDPEMTETDEANAPDDTGPTAAPDDLAPSGEPAGTGDQDEVGI